MTRSQTLRNIVRIPLVTLGCVVFCTTLFSLDFHKRIGTKHKHLCLSSHEIVRSGEVYRYFIHQYFHKGPWHLAITMIPMLILGKIIESQIGSILFFLVLVLCWLISTGLEVAMATMMYHVFHGLFHGCSLGFSGIVFGLIVIVTKFIKFQECRILQIPCSLLPWICVFLYYFGFHQGSVFLHLGGIVAGYAYKYDAFNCCLPSPEQLAEWEHSDRWEFILQLPCFIKFAQNVQSSGRQFNLPLTSSSRQSAGLAEV